MPLKQENINRQLAAAQEDLAARTKALEAAGKSEKECRKDPTWRSLRARCRKIANRHKAASAVIALTQKAEANRAESGSDE